MKRLIALCIFCTGCGSVKIDGLGTYRPSLFRKDVDEFTYTRSVNAEGTNIAVRLKGYSGGAEALVGSVAAGVAQGLSSQIKK
ncbi:MAG: hypothetical protein E6Q97_11135 [Desulfurellales bacterium]|nr:MAG: hypothetical protein E6Q97_11135 [Desulfurellales bacterium]